MKRGRTFYLDRSNGKAFGVCAGIARHFGWDPTIVRVGLVMATLLGGFPWTVIAYVAAALIAKKQPDSLYGLDEVSVPRTSAFAMRESARDIDRRIAEVDSFVASSNAGLAREIENLR